MVMNQTLLLLIAPPALLSPRIHRAAVIIQTMKTTMANQSSSSHSSMISLAVSCLLLLFATNASTFVSPSALLF